MSDFAEPVLIGVDGGGTGCRAAVGTARQGILAIAEGGPANVTTDRKSALHNVMTAIENAAQDAGIDHETLLRGHAYIGLAGVMSAKDSTQVANTLPFDRITVTDDRPTSVAGALGGRDGYLLAIGTGCIVAHNGKGHARFVNGWGFQLSDQGSGAWLGRAAMEQVLLCHDGLAEHSQLTQELMARFNDDPNQIVTFAANACPAGFAAFAPKVIEAAQSGDAIARDLMQRGAGFLTRGLQTLGFDGTQTLCLTGGVGPAYKAYLPEQFLAQVVAPKGSALDGAFYLAGRQAHDKEPSL